MESRSARSTTRSDGPAGELLGVTRTHDVIDAAVVLLASDGDRIATSDPDDLELLALAAGLEVEIVPV